jgi:NADH dehydrogenase
MAAMAQPHRVVIVGGGFGGLLCARHFRRVEAQVTLLDRRNFHLFQPLLYQVATGGLSPGNIAATLRSILRHHRNVAVLLGKGVDIDLQRRVVLLTDGELPYDTLVVATGSTHQYFGHNEWEAAAPGLKTVEDAVEIRRRIVNAFEAAERETDPAKVSAWLTFVIVGGGPTGVELAGAIAEIACRTLRNDFRHIDPRNSRIVLIEGNERVLMTFPPPLSEKARRSLKRLGVDLLLNSRVTGVEADHVHFTDADGEHTLPAHTCLWGAGVRPTRFGTLVAQRTGAPLDRGGRIMVEANLSVPGHPDIFAIGDLANYPHQTGEPLPGIAPVAMQQGAYVSRVVEARLRGRPEPKFHYVHRGIMATIGRASAVADLGPIHLWGWLGWMAWVFIHLVQIVKFQHRLLILIQWAWSYFTFSRSTLLITGEDLAPPVAEV